MSLLKLLSLVEYTKKLHLTKTSTLSMNSVDQELKFYNLGARSYMRLIVKIPTAHMGRVKRNLVLIAYESSEG